MPEAPENIVWSRADNQQIVQRKCNAKSKGVFPFVRTGWPDPSVCKENATI